MTSVWILQQSGIRHTFGAHYYGQLDEAAWRVALLATGALGVFAVWRLFDWLVKGPPPAEPWDDEIADQIASDEASPLCHRCLAPHDSQADFCPDCGAAVGTYTNWLPYPYIFSVGHTLRIGTDGAFRRSPVTIAGFIVLAPYEYVFFAPVYLFLFFRKLVSKPSADLPRSDQPGI